MRWIQKKFDCSKCGEANYYCVPQDEISTMVTISCKYCKGTAKRSDVSFKSLAKNTTIMDAVFVEGGVKVFENGKRKMLQSKRAVKEYEAKNNCTFGSDDLEQEADHNKAQKDKEYSNNVAEKVMKDFERLQWQKKATR